MGHERGSCGLQRDLDSRSPSKLSEMSSPRSDLRCILLPIKINDHTTDKFIIYSIWYTDKTASEHKKDFDWNVSGI